MDSNLWFEIRLFYVRITPCMVSTVPDHLSLRILRPELKNILLEINNSRIPSSEPVTITLRRDRINKETSEVTYISTDSIRITGGVEFEVKDVDDVVILCGSLERLDTTATWTNGKGGWSMDCFTSNCMGKGVVSSQSIEVYVAGCCHGDPVILTKTIQAVSPRRKRNGGGGLDVILEDEEQKEDDNDTNNDLVPQPKWQTAEPELANYEPDGKLRHNFYSDEMYSGEEDGQLTWFNAGVRVGVGIGLGMCLGVGIGVGLLMRSYQATTRNFRRRFL